jgi:glycosyltransferase involved in cell wall biosynthesis
VLRLAYRLFPFDLKGDCSASGQMQKGLISCLIPTNRAKDLDILLEDLTYQTLARDKFEVVIVNGQALQDVRLVVQKYSALKINYIEIKNPEKVLSNLRNVTLEAAQGEYVLLLDDDTRIIQNDFLQLSLKLFEAHQADVIIPKAWSLYGIVKAKYDFLDPYSMTSRCGLYRRKVLQELGGFNEGLNTYEDIELSIRAIIKKSKVFRSSELSYLHPPLYFYSMDKPLSIGQTIFQIKRHYSLGVWLLVYANALRFLIYGLLPSPVCRQWYKISLGVFLYPFKKKDYFY